jgi:hypothetical protein
LKCLRWVVSTSLLGVLMALGGCGGSNSLPYNQTPGNLQIFPSNITSGSQDFTVFISGTGFISSSKGVSFAYWNGSARSTYYDLTTGQLHVTILASDVAVPGQAQITVVNPPPGGGEAQAAATFYIEPAQSGDPAISSLSPSSAQANSKPPLIAITGSNFVVGDVVTWNGQSRASTSTFLDQSDMTIQPAATDLASAGTASVSVSDPGLIHASLSVNFTISGPNSAMPSVNSLTPSSATAGAADLEVLVKGSGFVPSSGVLWNSTPVATAYLSGSQLMALIPAADLAAAGSANVSVLNPAPGGGTSGNSTFTINGP